MDDFHAVAVAQSVGVKAAARHQLLVDLHGNAPPGEPEALDER
jgi:hypothetical protein